MTAPAHASDDAPYKFAKVQEVALNKSEIIKASHLYIAENFKYSKNGIQLNDPDAGSFIANLRIMDNDAGFFDAFKGITFLLSVEAKDKKFRIKATHIVAIDGNGAVSAFGDVNGSNRYRIEPLADKILNKLTADIQAHLEKEKDDAW